MNSHIAREHTSSATLHNVLSSLFNNCCPIYVSSGLGNRQLLSDNSPLPKNQPEIEQGSSQRSGFPK